jgi:chitinase
MRVRSHRAPGRMGCRVSIGAVLVLLLAQCGLAPVESPQHAARIVGYLPSWSGDVERLPYARLTHINYAFLRPNPDGSLQPIDNPAKLRALVARAHARKVAVLIAVGGWSGSSVDPAFEALAADPRARSTFTANMVAFVDQYQLDGVDIDWEYPRADSAGNFTALMRELHDALRPRAKLLTAAVVSEGEHAAGVAPEVFALVDWIGIMAYDGGEPHANLAWSIASLQFWLQRGLPATKAVLGIPLYARPGESFSYAQAVAADPANAERDCATVGGRTGCYNGLDTVRKKAEHALQHAGGVMVWELSQDTTDDSSLIAAIAQIVLRRSP